MWIEIILFILGLFVIVGVIIFAIKYNKPLQKYEIFPNMPIVENDYRSEFTNGYTIGVLKRVRQNKNGTKLVEFYPIDIQQGENVKLPYVQSVVVKNEFYKPFSTGELSDRRDRIKLVIRDPSKIPEKMKDTTEGEWATKEGQLGYIKSVFGSAISSGDEAIAEAMKEYARGESSRFALSNIKEEARIRRDVIQSYQEGSRVEKDISKN